MNDTLLIILFASIACLYALLGRRSRAKIWWVIFAFLFADAAINPLVYWFDSEWFSIIVPFKDLALACVILFIGCSRFSIMQALVALVIALSGFVLFVDVNTGSDLIYSNYELVIFALYFIQMAIGADGIATHIIKRNSGVYRSAWSRRKHTHVKASGPNAKGER